MRWNWNRPAANQHMAHRLAHVDLEILDALGNLPFGQAGGALLFLMFPELRALAPHVFSRRSSLAYMLDVSSGEGQVNPNKFTLRFVKPK